MPDKCRCGAHALELGLCGFCLEHSPATVRDVVRRLRDRVDVRDRALEIAIDTLVRMGLFATTGELAKLSPEIAAKVDKRRAEARHAL